MELHPHGTKAQPPRPGDDEAWPDDEVYWEWDDYEAEGDEALDGEETYYYDTENDTNPIDNAFNVDEYDDVFASYINAKNHLNRMRTSRGSVVAMVQQPPLRDGGKGGKSTKEKGKSSKGKGKPPSSRQMNPPQRGSAKS